MSRPDLRNVLCVAAVLLASVAPRARACEDASVRDATFAGDRDVHRLSVIAEAGDPEGDRILERLQAWLKGEGAGLNVKLDRVAAGDPAVHWEEEFRLPSAPPSLPVVVLTGSRTWTRESFHVDHWEPAPSDEDLRGLLTSPARDRIRDGAVAGLAVLLHIPASGSPAGHVPALLDAVAKRWSARTKLGVPIVQVDRTDRRERLLLSFVGLGESGEDWVSVVVGRGKRMEPLRGGGITEPALDQQLELLTQPCTCINSPFSLGVDIPMVWKEELASKVVLLSGQTADDSDAPATRPAAGAPSSVPEPPRADSRVLRTTAWAVGGVLVLVIAGTIAVMRLRRSADAV